MKLKSILIFIVFATLFSTITSCSEDDDNGTIVAGGSSYTPNPFTTNVTAREKFIDKNLMLTGYSEHINDSLSRSFDDIMECEKDDIFIFRKDGILEVNQGDLWCDPNDEAAFYLNWTLDIGGKMMSLWNEDLTINNPVIYTILKNDGMKLSITNTMMDEDYNGDGILDKVTEELTFSNQ